MKLKTKIITFVLVLSAVLNVGLIFVYSKSCNEIKHRQMASDNVHNGNFNLFSQHCYDLENGLEKLSACSQPEEAVRLLTDVVEDSGSAVAALSTLPLYPEYVSKLNGYLNRISDYSKFAVSECLSGKPLSGECKSNISSFSKTMSEVNKVLSELAARARIEPFNWSELMSEKLSSSGLFENSISDSMEEIQNNLIDYPTLIYDGPFSDSVINKKIEEQGGLDLTKDEAVTLLCGFIDLDGSFSVKEHTLCNGSIDTWAITLECNGVYYYGNVSVKSGEVISFISDTGKHSSNLSRDGAVERASEFLRKNGYENMIPQYCDISDGNATVNFVRSYGGVLVYPEMVKVRVDLENGNVNGFEGLSYYINHVEDRTCDFPSDFTTEETAALLPENASLVSSAKAVIPTDGGNELYAFEYRIKLDSSDFVIYFDAKTQKEVKIFKIMYSENGEFVV